MHNNVIAWQQTGLAFLLALSVSPCTASEQQTTTATTAHTATTTCTATQQTLADCTNEILLLKGGCQQLNGQLMQLTNVARNARAAIDCRQMNELVTQANATMTTIQQQLGAELATRTAVHTQDPTMSVYGVPLEMRAFLERVKERLATVSNELALSQVQNVSDLDRHYHQAIACTKGTRAVHALHRFFGIVAQNPDAHTPYLNTQSTVFAHARNNPDELAQVGAAITRKWFSQHSIAAWCNRQQPGCLALPNGDQVAQQEPYSDEIMAHRILGCARDLYSLLVARNRHLKVHLCNFVDKLSADETTRMHLIAQLEHVAKSAQSIGNASACKDALQQTDGASTDGKEKEKESTCCSTTAPTPLSTGTQELTCEDLVDHGIDLTTWICTTILQLTAHLDAGDEAPNTMVQQLFLYLTGEKKEEIEKEKQGGSWSFSSLNPFSGVKTWAKNYAFGKAVGGISALNKVVRVLNNCAQENLATITSVEHVATLLKPMRHGSPRARYLPDNQFSKWLLGITQAWRGEQPTGARLPSQVEPERPLLLPATETATSGNQTGEQQQQTGYCQQQ